MRKFYLELFKEIRKNKLEMNAVFESYYLPDEKFIKEFSYTFLKESIILLSPDTGSNELRKRIKTFYYSNKSLIETLNLLTKEKLNIHLYFSTGFPYETERDFSKTISLITYLKKISCNYKWR